MHKYGIIFAIALAGVIFLSERTNTPMLPSDIQSGALFYNPASGGVNEALSPGYAQVGTQNLNNSNGTALGDQTAPTTTTTGTAPNQYSSQAQSILDQLNNTYNQIYGGIDQAATGQKQNLDANYGNQYQQLNNQYSQNAAQLPWMFAARGTAGSTDQGMAQDNANQNYNTSNQAIGADQASKYAQLAQWALGQKANYHAAQNNLANVYQPQIATASPYLLQSLGTALQDAQGTLGGLGNNQQLQQGLQAITPNANQGANQLQQQLTDIKNASLPQFAKDQVASASINNQFSNDPTNQNYWLNYYSNLSKQPQTA